VTTTTTAPKKPAVPRVCKRDIKDDHLKKVPCNKRFIDGRCGNEAIHISKYKTGFCAKGWCEGKKPVTWNGKPAPSCKMWRTCGCECHDFFDTMFASTDRPREVVNYSEYHPNRHEFWMPTPEERMALLASSRPGAVDSPTLVESPLPEAVPATLRRTFTPTATGRAARGELESWVKDQCDIWLVEEEEFPCTPAYLAGEIGRTQGIKEPSVGAISAVFERWVKMGFAIVEKKPTRFICYTEQGVKFGLEGCKEKAKRDKRASQVSNEPLIRRREK
jgi:hypothetical protein